MQLFPKKALAATVVAGGGFRFLRCAKSVVAVSETMGSLGIEVGHALAASLGYERPYIRRLPLPRRPGSRRPTRMPVGSRLSEGAKYEVT